MLIGGGKNHRMGLFDMAMIKDNHISVAGGITNAIRSVDQFLSQNELKMEVEVGFLGFSIFFLEKKLLTRSFLSRLRRERWRKWRMC